MQSEQTNKQTNKEINQQFDYMLVFDEVVLLLRGKG